MDNTNFLDLMEIRILMKVSKNKNPTFGLDTTDFTEKKDKIYNNNHNKNNNNNYYYYCFYFHFFFSLKSVKSVKSTSSQESL